MDEVLIIGSGPAAVGAALATTSRGLRPTVIDLGSGLEEARVAALKRMTSDTPNHWTAEDVQLVSRQPIRTNARGLPEKRAYGSDFPFRDAGQLLGIDAHRSAHRAVVSSAYGGFSNVWGAQVMPFSRETFLDWPVNFDEMTPHYRAVLEEIPFAGVTDDLAETFPLLAEDTPLPPLSERTDAVLGRYERSRGLLRSRGVTMGQARLAVHSSDCVLCGLCMTGCPKSLIYSASHTMDRLRREQLITYRSGRMVVGLSEKAGIAYAHAKDLASGGIETLAARRIYVACGALGTTRLVAGSLDLSGESLQALESSQFTIPFVSASSTPDPRGDASFTLNQFNMVIRAGQAAKDLSQVHFYSYNPAFMTALPRVLHDRRLEVLTVELLKRLTVGIGYLPSWSSPSLSVGFTRRAASYDLPYMHIEQERPGWGRNRMLRTVFGKLTSTAPILDLWPVLPKTLFAAGAKSYHFGGTFPHGGTGRYASDRIGRLASWRNIHMVDASVFPSVPATTFTLSIMANAHRIAYESL